MWPGRLRGNLGSISHDHLPRADLPCAESDSIFTQRFYPGMQRDCDRNLESSDLT